MLPPTLYEAVCATLEQRLSGIFAGLLQGMVFTTDVLASAIPAVRDVCRAHHYVLVGYKIETSSFLFRFQNSKDLLSIALDTPGPKILLPVTAWVEVPAPEWYVRYEDTVKWEVGPFYEYEVDLVRSSLAVNAVKAWRVGVVHRDLRVGEYAPAPWPPLWTDLVGDGITPLATAFAITED